MTASTGRWRPGVHELVSKKLARISVLNVTINWYRYEPSCFLLLEPGVLLMRLTLRNLLAYLEDILEPEDSEQIRAKLEDSKFASDLVHRIRDSMKRLRLGAPDVNDRTHGLDPNTVAEYLDNTLHTDQVTDFEKVCLDSDVHLAEVASSHQILAMVLGEPAEVETTCRDRMYRLPALIAAQVKSAVENSERHESDHEDPETVKTNSQSKTTVPDYLRTQEKKRRVSLPIALVGVLLAGILGGMLLSVTGQFGPDTPLGKMFGVEAERADLAAKSNPSATDENETKSPSSTPDESDLSPLPTDPAEQETSSETEASPELPADGGPDKTIASPNEVESPKSEGSEDSTEIAADGEDKEPEKTSEEKGAHELAPTPDMVASLPKQPELPNAPLPDTGINELSEPGAEVAPLPPEPVGQLVSTQQILLRLELVKAAWQRVEDSEHLAAGDPLLSLPTFRPSVLIDNQVEAQLVDNSRVRLVDPDEEGMPGLIVEHGRLILGSATRPNVRLQLQTEQRSGVITFVDAETSLAIEATRSDVPGDPETQPSPLAMNLIASSGKFLWQEKGDQTPLAVSAPGLLTLNDQPLEVLAITEVPQWIHAENSMLDQRASSTVLRELKDERPISLLLRELAAHRQREVRWLAQRCQASIGEFRSMIEILDDLEQKALWPDYVDELRLTIREGPKTAAEIRTAMEKIHGPDGVGLYEMLWGYRKPLNDEAASRLVSYLEHDSLAFRRLAIWNLKEITGMGLHYFPEDTEARRQRSVDEWRDRFSLSSTDRNSLVESPMGSRESEASKAPTTPVP